MEFIIEVDMQASMEDVTSECTFDCGSNCVIDCDLGLGVIND